MDGVIDLGPAKRLRFHWYFGHDTLYKFRSFSGDLRKWVLDTIKNSRIYLPHPPAFNDPFDVSPVVAHGGDAYDPEYLRELQTEEARMHKAAGIKGRALDRQGSRVKVDAHTPCAECLVQNGVLGASEAVVDDWR
jgi:hypothetical protein